MSPEQQPRRQERGKRRIEEILDTADAVFAEVGYESATTNLIAERAGISPGSLYQYFSNKREIAEALSERYLRLLADVEGAIFDPALVNLSTEDLIDQVVDAMLGFNLAHPGAKSLLAGAQLSTEVAEASKGLHDALCTRVEGLVAERNPKLPPSNRQLVAEVSVQIYSALLHPVLDATSRQRPRLVRELKAALNGYWQSFDRS